VIVISHSVRWGSNIHNAPEWVRLVAKAKGWVDSDDFNTNAVHQPGSEGQGPIKWQLFDLADILAGAGHKVIVVDDDNDGKQILQ